MTIGAYLLTNAKISVENSFLNKKNYIFVES